MEIILFAGFFSRSAGALLQKTSTSEKQIRIQKHWRVLWVDSKWMWGFSFTQCRSDISWKYFEESTCYQGFCN